MAHLTKEQANQVFDIIVKYGAKPNLKNYFVGYVTKPAASTHKEFRFMGEFGSDGKLYVTSLKVYVGFYREDSTPERERRVDEANAELAVFKPEN